MTKRNKQTPIDLARIYSQRAHKNERLKFIVGPYFWHTKNVSRRMHSVDEKIVALLHDVVETKIKQGLGKNPDPQKENQLIIGHL